jgi:hypothetical protein
MKWSKTIPRESGYYWVRFPNPDPPPIDPTSILLIEGRDESDDGCVWLDGGEGRYFLTPGCRDEGGDDLQSEEWMEWLWAGPIPEPEEL